MCTAATYKTTDFYFGRTLDYDCSYGEEVTVTPRNFPFHFTQMGTLPHHYALIGMAHVADGYPLYYDAVNEKGLAMAGLNFVGNACYHPPGQHPTRDNVAVFELLPWLLGQCATVAEARTLLGRVTVTDTPFSDALPPAQLHWLLADRQESLTLEPVEDGLKLYPNPVGVLTNNPPFATQLFALNNYRHLSPAPTADTFSPTLRLPAYSRGLGAFGLPGDLSSQSRFIRAAFVKENALSDHSEPDSVGQFFHILGAVEQPRGCCRLENGEYEITLYTSCCNTDKGIYYYTTYTNHRITAVDMHREDLDGQALTRYPLCTEEQIHFIN